MALDALGRFLGRRQRGCRVIDQYVELREPLVEAVAKARTEASEERSMPMTLTAVAPVLSVISIRASSPRWVLRQPRITSAPMRASSRAVSLPMPLLAPVTSATRPERSTLSGW
jgi:hypothetical protein